MTRYHPLVPSNARTVLDRLLADPPLVHAMADGEGGEVFGIWRTSRSSYDLIVQSCDESSRTLETGLGISTALFAALGATHTCVTPSAIEAERMNRYLNDHGIDSSRLTIVTQPSDAYLPTMAECQLDFVLIDGSHGFPAPIIDWFYACRWLRRRGIVVLDDVQLPAVDMVVLYLDRDPRWKRIQGDEKSVAFERLSEDLLSEDWWHQRAFFHGPDRKYFLKKARTKLRRAWVPMGSATRRS